MKKVTKRIKDYVNKLLKRLKAYFKHLLFPIYYFPIKLFTYSLYYLIKFIVKLILAIFSLIFETIRYPFKSVKHFLKFLLISGAILYMFASLFVITDYLTKEYGWWGKFLCSVGAKDKLQNSVVRVVGGYSEGSGFFITDKQILTNFHVIADEPSPKIIFPDGSFITPIKIAGDKDVDLAVLFTEKSYPNMVLALPKSVAFYKDEPVLATGYPLGTELTGKATTVKGNFVDFRKSSKDKAVFIQTNISLVQGMSGGPLADQCASVVGINTLSLAGLSLFVAADQAEFMIPSFTDQEIKKINVDPSISPEEAVKAFYTYLKARRMEDGFKLLSREYLKKTNFEEWTNRFTDILDVEVILTKQYENTKDTAFIKFSTKNWIDGEAKIHYYEGIWQTILEDGVYKMLKSNIKEIEDPDYSWFYE